MAFRSHPGGARWGLLDLLGLPGLLGRAFHAAPTVPALPSRTVWAPGKRAGRLLPARRPLVVHSTRK